MTELTKTEIIELKEFLNSRREEDKIMEKWNERTARAVKNASCKKCGKVKVHNWVSGMMSGGNPCQCKNSQ